MGSTFGAKADGVAEPPAPEGVTVRDHVAAGGVIGAHSLKHFYQQGFYVILPELYAGLALTPIAAGALEMVRRVSGGVASMAAGVVLDRFQDKRVFTLYLSLFTMGLCYALLGVVPTYVVILVAAGLAMAAGSIWHPAALSMLSQRYPHRRGFLIALHRSSGSVGDVVGPLVVGALLVVLAWQDVLYGAVPLSLVFALLLWVTLRGAPDWGTTARPAVERRTLRVQMGDLRIALRNRSLLLLLLVGALGGLGQGGLMMWLGIYLAETQAMGSLGIGAHIALLTAFGIIAGPLIGMCSDRAGRKPVIVGVLAAKTGIAALMGIAGGGPLLTVLVALMGTVMFGVNSLIQAGALDLVDGQQLEGSVLGLMWGNNALFGGLSPLLLGALISLLGLGVLFWYVAAVNLLALAAAVTMTTVDRRRASAV